MHSSGCILQGIVNRQVGVFYCRREFSCLVWNKKSACLQLFYFCLQFHFKTPFTPGHFGIARNLKTQVQVPLFSMAPKMCCCRLLHHNPGISHGMKLVTQKKLLLLFGQQASCNTVCRDCRITITAARFGCHWKQWHPNLLVRFEIAGRITAILQHSLTLNRFLLDLTKFILWMALLAPHTLSLVKSKLAIRIFFPNIEGVPAKPASVHTQIKGSGWLHSFKPVALA